MKTISSAELDALCLHGKAIDKKSGYPAVILHPDGTATKIWARKKGFFSSSTLRPYSLRFIKNATELIKRGIEAPEILNHAKLENSHVRIVTYKTLPGTSIRELLKSSPEQVNIITLTEYIAELHQKGISFGGMHLGNIIQRSGDQGYGLIDFTDVKFYNHPLTLTQRAANLYAPLRYREDTERIKRARLPDLLTSYLNHLSLSKSEELQALAMFKSHLK